MNENAIYSLADLIIGFNQDAESIGQRPFDKNQIEALASFCAAQNKEIKISSWVGYIEDNKQPLHGIKY